MRSLQRLLPRDPRDLQIAFLATFLVLGVAVLGLQIEPWMPPLCPHTSTPQGRLIFIRPRPKETAGIPSTGTVVVISLSWRSFRSRPESRLR